MIQITNQEEKKVCPDTNCKDVHLEINVCECGACMYHNATRVLEEEGDYDYPFYDCLKCKRRHFWD